MPPAAPVLGHMGRTAIQASPAAGAAFRLETSSEAEGNTMRESVVAVAGRLSAVAEGDGRNVWVRLVLSGDDVFVDTARSTADIHAEVREMSVSAFSVVSDAMECVRMMPADPSDGDFMTLSGRGYCGAPYEVGSEVVRMGDVWAARAWMDSDATGRLPVAESYGEHGDVVRELYTALGDVRGDAREMSGTTYDDIEGALRRTVMRRREAERSVR